MIGSLVLVSLLTTTLIARITVNRVEGAAVSHARDLTGKRLAAVGGSSGAEYLDAQHVAYEKFGNLPQALGALAAGKTDAVVNSVGALQYLVRTRFRRTDRAAARPTGSRLYGFRVADELRLEEVTGPRLDDRYGEPGMAINRGSLFRSMRDLAIARRSR